MSTHAHFPPGKAGAAVVGTLAGGAAGFLVAELVAVFLGSVLGWTPDEDGSVLPAPFLIGAPVVCAVVGTVVAVRLAGRGRRS
ncbi:hypothetical protein ACFYT4_29300 [Streptomyces sp. NPDC004609]|uniref:hypothetical protein n=1 Tax=Streptomyces sp. NPDC004609 TaxID=3364704 RepID=UPI0036BF5698